MYSVKSEKLNKGVFVLVNILVVEDDAKLNQIVCAHLNKNGYSATGCFTADEAYNVFVNGENIGEMKTNMSGKLSISVELAEGNEVSVKITK